MLLPICYDLNLKIAEMWAGTESAHEKQTANRGHNANPMEITIIDHGRFAFLEFEGLDASPDRPAIAGIHVLQVVPTSLASRATFFPALDPTMQVQPIPGMSS